MRRPLVLVLLLGCATAPPQHGTVSGLTTAGDDAELCEHRVPGANCTRCHPELEATFKKAGDWCGEHGIPESQCTICHPDLTFEALPELPAGADVRKISTAGEDVSSLDEHAVAGKVTLFDFYADWCAPCRKIDQHVFTMLQTRDDLALRKLNVVSWETPLAKRWLVKVPSLPYVLVYGRDGKLVRAISGLDIAALDAAIAEGAAR